MERSEANKNSNDVVEPAKGGEASGKSIAEAVSVYLMKEFQSRAEYRDYPDQAADQINEDIANEIRMKTGLKRDEYNLFPAKAVDTCRKLSIFIAIPTTRWNKEDYSSGLWHRHKRMWRMTDRMVAHILGRCRGRIDRAVFITADWRSSDLDRWGGTIDLIREGCKLEFFLVHGRKATEVYLGEDQGRSGGYGIMLNEERGMEGRFAKEAAAIYKSLEEKKWDGTVACESIEQSVTAVLGDERKSLYIYPCHKKGPIKDTAVFVCLEGAPYSLDLEIQLTGGFDDAVRSLVSYLQRPGRGKCKDAVLITDTWSADVFREWGDNLTAISEKTNLEIYLATGKSIHRIVL